MVSGLGSLLAIEKNREVRTDVSDFICGIRVVES